MEAPGHVPSVPSPKSGTGAVVNIFLTFILKNLHYEGGTLL